MNIRDHVCTLTAPLHTHHTDPFLSARFPFYCRLIQEGAARHAYEAGCANEDLFKAGKGWVLSRLAVTVERYVEWPSDIRLETWIQPPFRLLAPREARGLDAAGNTLFRAMAYWVVIDLQRRRPERPDVVNRTIGFSEDRSRWQAANLEKLPAVDPPADAVRFSPHLSYRDIDSVRHINNISYIEWIMETFSHEYKAEFKPFDFEINFLAESFLDSRLSICTWPAGSEHPSSWHHLILQEQADGTAVEACRARSGWAPRSRMLPPAG